MGKNSIHLRLSQKEIAYFNKRAGLKNKSLGALLHAEMNKAFAGIEVSEDGVCEGSKERIDKVIDIPPRLWKVLVCLSRRLGLRPGELVYRVIVAPHLQEIIKEGSSVTEVINSD